MVKGQYQKSAQQLNNRKNMKRFKYEVWIETDDEEIQEHEYKKKFIEFLNQEKTVINKRIIIKGIAKKIPEFYDKRYF